MPRFALTGGEGIIRAYVQGARILSFIGSVKNILTHSLLAKPEIKRMEEPEEQKNRHQPHRQQPPLLHRSSPAASWN